MIAVAILRSRNQWYINYRCDVFYVMCYMQIIACKFYSIVILPLPTLVNTTRRATASKSIDNERDRQALGRLSNLRDKVGTQSIARTRSGSSAEVSLRDVDAAIS